MQILKEDYNIKVHKFKKKDGTWGRVAYIDPNTSENVYNVKDVLKTKYNAIWNPYSKQWQWYLYDDPEKNKWVINNLIYPAIDYLVSVENNGAKTRNAEDIKRQLEPILLGIQKVVESPTDFQGSQNLKAKLQEFKEELVNMVSSDDFKKKMEPIIKFKQAQGHQFSLLNAILTYIQDPEATLVKSRSKWAAVNREVLPDAKRIALWVPVGGTPLKKEEKNKIIDLFLKSCNVKSIEELTITQREELDIALKPKHTGFDIMPYFYDVRFTKQIEGTENLIGDPKALDNLEWFENGEETPQTKQLAGAIIKTIEESGVKLNYVDDLGGARGVAKGTGEIDVLKNTPQNAGLVNTLIHEFAHQCLHLRYLSAEKNGSEWSSFFINEKQGRGMIEQQAELTAWIVLKSFGIDLHTSFNYMGCWGIDQKNATKVFDTVSNVATNIIKSMKMNLGNVNESKEQLQEITGRELAQMLGLTKLYDYGAQFVKKDNKKENKDNKDLNMENKNKRTVRITESQLYEAINKGINEAVMDEAWTDFLRGAGSAIGNKFKNAGQRVANNVVDKAKAAGQAVAKQYNDVKRAGQMASAQAEINKVISYIQQKQREGIFGNPGDACYRQVGAAIGTLKKAAAGNFNNQFSQEK